MSWEERARERTDERRKKGGREGGRVQAEKKKARCGEPDGDKRRKGLHREIEKERENLEKRRYVRCENKVWKRKSIDVWNIIKEKRKRERRIKRERNTEEERETDRVRNTERLTEINREEGIRKESDSEIERKRDK